MSETLCVLDVILRSAEHLKARGVETARLDAELMLAHVLGVTRLDLYMQFDHPLDPDDLAKTRELLRRRAQREPLAHLTGEREFFSLGFEVSPDVLIPRPDTELLVEEMLRLEDRGLLPEGRLLDVGTGSGAIAIAMAAHMPEREIIATDLSPAALAIAQRNAERHGVEGRVGFLEGDLLAMAPGPLAAIVSNPPYIGTGERSDLSPEVLREPEDALFAGADGLDVIRRLIQVAPGALAKGGHLLIEHGHTQAAAVRDLMIREGFIDVRSLADLASIERVTAGRRD